MAQETTTAPAPAAEAPKAKEKKAKAPKPSQAPKEKGDGKELGACADRLELAWSELHRQLGAMEVCASAPCKVKSPACFGLAVAVGDSKYKVHKDDHTQKCLM